MEFKEMIEQIMQGKKVKRHSWCDGSYLHLRKNEIVNNFDVEVRFSNINSLTADDWEVYEESKTENCQGALWLTTMGRIVLDNHGCETFFEPYDKKVMTNEELRNGIKVEEFIRRIVK